MPGKHTGKGLMPYHLGKNTKILIHSYYLESFTLLWQRQLRPIFRHNPYLKSGFGSFPDWHFEPRQFSHYITLPYQRRRDNLGTANVTFKLGK